MSPLFPSLTRRESTYDKAREVKGIYDKVLESLGEAGAYVSKGYLYEKVSDSTGYSVRQVYRLLTLGLSRNTDDD